jgi:hypothetical protein
MSKAASASKNEMMTLARPSWSTVSVSGKKMRISTNPLADTPMWFRIRWRFTRAPSARPRPHR